MSRPIRLPLSSISKIANSTTRITPAAAIRMDPLRVFTTPAEESRKQALPKARPSHWNNESGVGFHNPWDSWTTNGIKVAFGAFTKLTFQSSRLLDNIEPATALPITKPTWGSADKDLSKIRATWLGHACYMVELPASSPTAKRGPRVLFDPVFSDRCSPSQWVGPKRFTPIPCEIEEIPEIDAVVISHNHYDHMDTHTLTTLFKRSRLPHIFAPLGNDSYFRSLGIPKSHIHTLDWWESRRLENTASEVDFAIDITCTPAQHQTGRGVHDQSRTLWGSWVVQGVSKTEEANGAKVYFGGDTGYRSVKSDDVLDDESLPFCPVFKEIGKKFGGFDLALLPIGAYHPRQFMSPMHVSPPQSVHIFKDIQAKKALGMHWGTWILTTEDILDPPKQLAKACKEAGLESGAFDVCNLGETRFFSSS